MRIVIDHDALKRGRVTLEAENQSKTLVHEVLIARDIGAGTLPFYAQADLVIESRVHRLGEISNLAPGKTGKLTLNLKPGPLPAVLQSARTLQGWDGGETAHCALTVRAVLLILDQAHYGSEQGHKSCAQLSINRKGDRSRLVFGKRSIVSHHTELVPALCSYQARQRECIAFLLPFVAFVERCIEAFGVWREMLDAFCRCA